MHPLEEEGPMSTLKAVVFVWPERYSHYACEMKWKIQPLEV